MRNNKSGFTLIELVVVVIIIGILATLGILNYRTAMEKSRAAEAKSVIGQIRGIAAAWYLEKGDMDTPQFNDDAAGIGAGADRIPATGACRGTHYFGYQVNAAGTTDASLRVTATRCTASGKTPNGPFAGTVILDSNFVTGADAWTGTF